MEATAQAAFWSSSSIGSQGAGPAGTSPKHILKFEKFHESFHLSPTDKNIFIKPALLEIKKLLHDLQVKRYEGELKKKAGERKIEIASQSGKAFNDLMSQVITSTKPAIILDEINKTYIEAILLKHSKAGELLEELEKVQKGEAKLGNFKEALKAALIFYQNKPRGVLTARGAEGISGVDTIQLILLTLKETMRKIKKHRKEMEERYKSIQKKCEEFKEIKEKYKTKIFQEIDKTIQNEICKQILAMRKRFQANKLTQEEKQVLKDAELISADSPVTPPSSQSSPYPSPKPSPGLRKDKQYLEGRKKEVEDKEPAMKNLLETFIRMKVREQAAKENKEQFSLKAIETLMAQEMAVVILEEEIKAIDKNKFFLEDKFIALKHDFLNRELGHRIAYYNFSKHMRYFYNKEYDSKKLGDIFDLDISAQFKSDQEKGLFKGVSPLKNIKKLILEFSSTPEPEPKSLKDEKSQPVTAPALTRYLTLT